MEGGGSSKVEPNPYLRNPSEFSKQSSASMIWSVIAITNWISLIHRERRPLPYCSGPVKEEEGRLRYRTKEAEVLGWFPTDNGGVPVFLNFTFSYSYTSDQIKLLLDCQERLCDRQSELRALLGQCKASDDTSKDDASVEDLSGAFEWDSVAGDSRFNVFGISSYRANQQVMGHTALGIPGQMLTSITSKEDEKSIYKALEKVGPRRMLINLSNNDLDCKKKVNY